MRKASTRLPEQGTQTPSPAPDLIPAEPKDQPRTRMAIGTANGGTSEAHRERTELPISHRNGAPIKKTIFDLIHDKNERLSFKPVRSTSDLWP